LRVSWQAEVKGGSGDLRIDRAGDLWVVHTQGGEAASLSATTGTRRARLVGDSGPFDRYSQAARVLHGTLIGPDKLQLAAVDVSTGKVRWKRTVGGLDPDLDEYSLRDWLSIVEAGGQFSQSHYRSGGRAAQVSARFPVGERTLELVGIIYMR
jgi:outer membrane protein assembly factor BamB